MTTIPLKDWLIVLALAPLGLVFHLINKYDRSVLFVWRNKL